MPLKIRQIYILIFIPLQKTLLSLIMSPKSFMIPLLISLLSSLVFTTNIQSEPSHIIEVFRHGARGPLSGYDKTWHSHEYGALTAAGTRQHYILGKALAKKYPKFFSKSYNPHQIYVLSDTSVRCVQSAQAHLDGIFEGKGLSLRNDFAPEVAVPPFVDPAVRETVASISHSSALSNTRVPAVVNIVDGSNSAVFQRNRGAFCPNAHKWESENAWDHKTKEAWHVTFKPTLDTVNSYLAPNHTLKGNVDVAIFGDAMLVNLYDNRTLLGGLNDSDLLANFTSAFSWFVFHIEYGQLIQRQLSAYHTVEAMLDQLVAFRQGVKYHQVAMFSGHDYNLYALLAAFGVVTEECLMENFLSYVANKTTPHPHCVFPHFAANIILEFYNHTNQVKFLYNNMVIPICGTQETCDYEEFLMVARNATGNNTFASFQEKCGIDLNGVPHYLSQEELLTQNQQAESEQLIVATSDTVKQKVIISHSYNYWLVITLFLTIVLCLILTAKLISNKRAYAVLYEEAKEKEKAISPPSKVEDNVFQFSPPKNEEHPFQFSPPKLEEDAFKFSRAGTLTDIDICVKL